MSRRRWSRREFVASGAAGAAAVAAGALGALSCGARGKAPDAVAIVKAASYEIDLAAILDEALSAVGVGAAEVRGRRVLLKPNLVETSRGISHINTHPAVVRATAEALRRRGAAEVAVGEGPGHRRDTVLVLEESGLADVLARENLRFVDFNREEGFVVRNMGGRSGLLRLTLPAALREFDWIVSLAKMKTHHWAGVTLAMKNLFGLMPGSFYGWPKNVLHFAGLEESILDINATVRPEIAIVDGIVGMEGDGPIMGTAKAAGVLVVGRNLPAVDATAARVMGVDPLRVPYLAAADGWLGPVRAEAIAQVGEPIASVATKFELVATIPAQKRLLDEESAANY